VILLDSNILIDLRGRDPRWSEWTRRQLSWQAQGESVVNPVILAEMVQHFASSKDQREALAMLEIQIVPLTASAAWVAGQAHRAYRRAGGPRAAILADFLIGGHAVSLGATLMTRDRQRFASYFPDLSLLTPETHP